MNINTIIGRSNFSKWRWKFKRKHVYFLPFSLDESLDPLTIKSSTKNNLVVLHGDKLTINRHYHFDGATYAPDFKSVLLAAALHDSLLQLHELYPDQVSISMANLAFKREMQEQRFSLWPIYSLAVKIWFAFK